VVLAGNPNVGKSVVFNALTGQYVTVSNLPGTTVDVARGALDARTQLQDTPGVYGLSGLSEEETVAEKAILAADCVINVISALTLGRDLFLTQQLLDYGVSLVVVVNQLDEAEARSISLNLPRLETLLGVPVVGCVATQGQGVDAVRQAVGRACQGHTTPDAPTPEGVRDLEKNPARRMTLYGHRRQHVNRIVSQVLDAPSSGEAAGRPASWHRRVSETLARCWLHPVLGSLSALFILLALYQIIGVWVAGDLVNFTENQVVLAYVTPAIQAALDWLLPKEGPVALRVLAQILGGEFGLLTMGVQYILGVLAPLVLGFYLYLSVLEDCGYLPRIAVLADGMFRRMGLNGRAVIPMILGMGCVTMAMVSTRVLTSSRERTIAATLLAITIPCSAQIGVIVGLMALAGGFGAWAVYCVTLLGLMLAIGAVLNRLMPGAATPLVLDLPPVRLPAWRNLWKKTWVRTVGFLKEATPMFLLGSLLVSILHVTGWMTDVQKVLGPLTQDWLHLPPNIASAFVMGMVRRDFGAAGLYMMAPSLTPTQILTCLMVITLFVPCVATATVMGKERGLRESLTILIASWLIAFAVGGVFTRLLELF
jgi:ferrous iron transport protein B